MNCSIVPTPAAHRGAAAPRRKRRLVRATLCRLSTEESADACSRRVIDGRSHYFKLNALRRRIGYRAAIKTLLGARPANAQFAGLNIR